MDPTDNPTTIILLSGGMKCSTLLFELVRLDNRPVMEAMVFNTEAATDEYMPAKAMAARAGVPISLWNISIGPFMDVGLEAQPDEPTPFGDDRMELLYMLLNAAYRAKQRGALRVVTGHLADELDIEPDDFVDLIDAVTDFVGVPEDTFESPYWHMSLADVFWKASELSVLGEITAYTNSCLEGDHETPQSPWGFGCGHCAGCETRAAAWVEYAKRLKK